MTKMGSRAQAAFLVSSVLLVTLFAAGCLQEDGGKAMLTTVFTGDASAGAKMLDVLKAEVPVEDIESLTVMITRIVLDKAADEADDDDDADDADEGDGEEETIEKLENAEQIEVFSGEMRVNILDLAGVSQLISLEEVPAGHYTKIRLEIQDPELVFKAEPETVYTNIHLTANDRLFITVDFELEDGDNRVLVLDFGGIHLVALGNGDYNLTPQLRAELEILTVESTFVQGVIESIDYETNSIVLAVEGGQIAVTYGDDAEIFLASDDDVTPTGLETDLLAEMEIICFGDLFSDNTMTASRIEVVPEEVEDPAPTPEE